MMNTNPFCIEPLCYKVVSSDVGGGGGGQQQEQVSSMSSSKVNMLSEVVKLVNEDNDKEADTDMFSIEREDQGKVIMSQGELDKLAEQLKQLEQVGVDVDVDVDVDGDLNPLITQPQDEKNDERRGVKRGIRDISSPIHLTQEHKNETQEQPAQEQPSQKKQQHEPMMGVGVDNFDSLASNVRSLVRTPSVRGGNGHMTPHMSPNFESMLMMVVTKQGEQLQNTFNQTLNQTVDRLATIMDRDRSEAKRREEAAERRAAVAERRAAVAIAEAKRREEEAGKHQTLLIQHVIDLTRQQNQMRQDMPQQVARQVAGMENVYINEHGLDTTEVHLFLHMLFDGRMYYPVKIGNELFMVVNVASIENLELFTQMIRRYNAAFEGQRPSIKEKKYVKLTVLPKGYRKKKSLAKKLSDTIGDKDNKSRMNSVHIYDFGIMKKEYLRYQTANNGAHALSINTSFNSSQLFERFNAQLDQWFKCTREQRMSLYSKSVVHDGDDEDDDDEEEEEEEEAKTTTTTDGSLVVNGASLSSGRNRPTTNRPSEQLVGDSPTSVHIEYDKQVGRGGDVIKTSGKTTNETLIMQHQQEE